MLLVLEDQNRAIVPIAPPHITAVATSSLLLRPRLRLLSSVARNQILRKGHHWGDDCLFPGLILAAFAGTQKCRAWRQLPGTVPIPGENPENRCDLPVRNRQKCTSKDRFWDDVLNS